jgi:hypothetical protein
MNDQSDGVRMAVSRQCDVMPVMSTGKVLGSSCVPSVKMYPSISLGIRLTVALEFDIRSTSRWSSFFGFVGVTGGFMR